MLRIDRVELIEGVSCYADESEFATYYLVPNQPRIRLDEKGRPVFKFIKYRYPADFVGDKKGGGFAIFDVEFVVPDEVLKKVQPVLQDRVKKRWQDMKRDPQTCPKVKIGPITYTRGTSHILLSEGNQLVEKVNNAGKPSLYGNNVSAFNVELGQHGATLFESALQGKGGFVSVVYELFFWAKMPPITGRIWFDSRKFYSFYQHQDVDWEWWFWHDDSKVTTTAEMLTQSESGGVYFDFAFALPDPKLDKELKDTIRNWGWKLFQDTLQKKMAEIQPVPADKQEPEGGWSSYTKNVFKSSSFHFNYDIRESQAIEWNINPQGTLPNITNIQGVKWADYASVVDLNDPFFQQVQVTLQVNADFKQLPIYSVDADVKYANKNMPVFQDAPLSFKSADDSRRCMANLEGNNRKYKFGYIVNYVGESRRLEVPPKDDDKSIQTINVGDLGIFTLAIEAGDINFDQVQEAQVTIQYQEAGMEKVVEGRFLIDSEHRAHRMQEVTFVPQKTPYKYRVKYLMVEGKEFEGDWKEANSPTVFIDDPFSAQKTIAIRALGDLDAAVDTIFVDVKYIDEANGYVVTKSFALGKDTPFVDWVLPVISETAGRVIYSGTIKYRDTTVEAIPETVATDKTILVGPKAADLLEISVETFGCDFERLLGVVVHIQYEESPGVIQSKDVRFNKDGSYAAKFEMKDKARSNYKWKADFFLKDHTSRTTPDWVNETTLTIVPMLPA